MKPYRFKHIPTGLYLDYRSHTHKLTTIGKIYTSGINGLNYSCEPYIYVECHGRLLKSDFVKEEVEVKIKN